MDLTLPTDAVTKTADHAALQTPTWWVAALLVILLIATVLLIKWFVRTYEDLAKHHEEVMQNMIIQQQKTISELATVLAKNTDALNGCREALHEHALRQVYCARLQDELRRTIPRVMA